MQNIQFTTDDGFRFEKVRETISVSGIIGGYRNLGTGEEFYYYSDLLDISEVQKLEFENRVRELIFHVNILARGVDG